MSSGNLAVSSVILAATPPSVTRLVANQGRFRIKDGNVETVLPDLHLDILVVGTLSHETKSFYAKAYKPGDEEKNKQPDCSSLLGDAPDAGVPSPQCATCAVCPQNAWGSKITEAGKEVKACSDYWRIAITSADDPETIYQCNIPPASIKGWKKYNKTLSLRNVDASMVVTRVSLNEHLWVFDFAGFANAEQYAAVERLLGSTEVQDVLGLFGHPQQRAATPTPIAAPTPTPTPAPAAPPPPPAPAKGFGKKAAAVPSPAPTPAAPAAPATGSGLDDLAAELGALIGGAADV